MTQLSVLGPLPFSSSMLQIISEEDFYCYAEDTQLYVILVGRNASELSNVLACLSDIKCYMSQNFLRRDDFQLEALISRSPT